MALAPGYCYESDYIGEGGTCWILSATVEVVDIPNSSEVKVKVYPMHEGVVNLTMREGHTYDFIEFQVPFRIKVTRVFYSDNYKIAQFTLCDLVAPTPPPEPTLYINYLLAGLNPVGDVLDHNRYGVKAQVAIKGTGVGHLKLKWGSDHEEVIKDVGESNMTYFYNLPPGNHTVCADLFNIEYKR